jgi:dTDP-4-dehydrorhamnose 3,5-epimerase
MIMDMSPVELTEFGTQPTSIEGLLVVRTRHVDDDRGTVREMFRESVISGLGEQSLSGVRQVNLTFTRWGAIRGLHGESMAKLVGVAAGRGYGAYVDARPGSGSFGTLVTLDLEPGTQLLVPSGVCNGFQSLSAEGSLYLYCFDAEWTPGMPAIVINPLDQDLAIPWPVTVDPTNRALLSEKDATAPSYAEVCTAPGPDTAG